MTDLTKIKKPFGLLSAKKKKALREYKGTIEVYGNKGWASVDCPGFFSTATYRAKPMKLPEWPTGLLPEWKWIAKDESEWIYAYDVKPKCGKAMWHDSVSACRIDNLIPISFDGTPWREAIIKRPEGV
jgi:hypothetical protein